MKSVIYPDSFFIWASNNFESNGTCACGSVCVCVCVRVRVRAQLSQRMRKSRKRSAQKIYNDSRMHSLSAVPIPPLRSCSIAFPSSFNRDRSLVDVDHLQCWTWEVLPFLTIHRMAQEPNWKPELSESFFQLGTERGTGTAFQEPQPEPKPRLSVKTLLQHRETHSQRNRRNQNPEPLELFHVRAATETNRGHSQGFVWFAGRKWIQGATKRGRQKSVRPLFFSLSGLLRSLFGRFSDASN